MYARHKYKYSFCNYPKPTLIAFFGQDFYVNARACVLNSKYENVPRTCIASVDSVVDCRRWYNLFQSKGNFFLYSIATTNLTMDSSTKMIEDGIAEYLFNHNL